MNLYAREVRQMIMENTKSTTTFGFFRVKKKTCKLNATKRGSKIDDNDSAVRLME